MSTVAVPCQYCGNLFEVNASRLRWGRGRSCSRACQYASNRQKLSRKVTLTCIGCGAAFERSPRHVGTHGKGKYCTRACRDRNRVSSQHPQYKGRPDPYRGPNWQAQRRAARQRDNRVCRGCGAEGTDVHHIVPYRLFTDYRQANHLDNLVTLCRACHRRADAEFQAAEAIA